MVIVGGGIIGCACAFELAGLGLKVTLLERDELAAGASGRNQGLFGIPADPALAEMARSGLAVYRDEVVETSAVPVAFDREPIGELMLAVEDDQVEALRAHVEEKRAIGIDGERLDDAQLAELEPAVARDLAEAWLLPDVRRMDPGALTVALATLARERGAEIRHHVNARGLVPAGDGVGGVATDDGVIAAETVIVAAGPWSPQLLRPVGIDLPLRPSRGWLVRLAARPNLLNTLVNEYGPDYDHEEPIVRTGMLARGDLPEPDVGALAHQAPDGDVFAGASHSTAIGPEPEDPRVPRMILERAIRVVPALADLPVRQTWWGIRPMSPDDRPMIGRVREGLLVATGHGPEGVLLGAGTAKLVASLISGGEPPFDPEPFDPGRFAR